MDNPRIYFLILLFSVFPELGYPEAPSPSPIPPFKVTVEHVKPKNGKEWLFTVKDSTGKKILETLQDNINPSNAYSHEYNSGSLFFIKRITTPQDWIDELWCIDTHNKEKKLHAGKGLDFRISKNSSLIAVKEFECLTIMKLSGDTLKRYTTKEVGADGFDNPQWDDPILWIENVSEPAILGYLEIDTKLWTVKSYPNTGGFDGTCEIDFNTQKGWIAFSDRPFGFDISSEEEYVNSGATATLFVWNIRTNEKITVATSIGKWFHPAWVDGTTVEYDDPKTGKRIRKTITFK